MRDFRIFLQRWTQASTVESCNMCDMVSAVAILLKDSSKSEPKSEYVIYEELSNDY